MEELLKRLETLLSCTNDRLLEQQIKSTKDYVEGMAKGIELALEIVKELETIKKEDAA